MIIIAAEKVRYALVAKQQTSWTGEARLSTIAIELCRMWKAPSTVSTPFSLQVQSEVTTPSGMCKQEAGTLHPSLSPKSSARITDHHP